VRVVAVVVTYNRCADLASCLEALAGQTHPLDGMVVVDNASTDETAQFLAGRRDIVVRRSDRNAGGAGGFRIGLEFGVREEVDWLWVMDDDSLPRPDTLERLLESQGARRGDVGALAPSVKYADGGIGAGYRRRDSDTDPGPERDWAPFVGLLIRRTAAVENGPVRDDFFIASDDTEYCLRMRSAGWKIIAVDAATMWHPAASSERTLFGRKRTFSALPPWKEYYDARNRLAVDLATRTGPLRDARPWRRRAREEVAYYLLLVICDRRTGAARAAMRCYGHVHAILGRTGARVRPGQTSPWT
jgi:rhamnopyranosyl-N-acetylglucosaminyl-diphospho-decaprenol beta-1,3/1,4-galactofuranosyltransferase